MANYINPFEWINYARSPVVGQQARGALWDPLRGRYLMPTDPGYGMLSRRHQAQQNDQYLFSGDVAATPGGRSYWNENPDISYSVFTNNAKGPRRYNDWLRNQYGRIYGGYNSQVLSGLYPSLQWLDYLSGQDLGNMWNSASMSSRGISQAPFARRLFG